MTTNVLKAVELKANWEELKRLEKKRGSRSGGEVGDCRHGLSFLLQVVTSSLGRHVLNAETVLFCSSAMFGPSSYGTSSSSSTTEENAEPPVPAEDPRDRIEPRMEEPETPVEVRVSVTETEGETRRERQAERKEVTETMEPNTGEPEAKRLRRVSEVKIHLDAEVPDRVARALRKSETLEDYRRNRVFTYLHMFAGPEDMLKKSIMKKAAEVGLKSEVESLDRKQDPALDLTTEASYQTIGQSVDQGEWDGFHSGFPCGSFSRARHNRRGQGPPPVRDASNIYGYDTNTKEMQREADAGTLMASQSGWIYERQVLSQRRRKVPEIGTMENPPGSKESGSAWDLPELKQALKSTSGSVAEFNTCQYQSKLKARWYKPARWCGRLEGIGALSKVCKCPPWVTHISLVGKDLTEKAGAYPVELTDKVADMVVAVWRRTLNLEWWRYQLKEKKEKVDAQKESLLKNEERWRKRTYEETAPVSLTPVTKAINSSEDFSEVPSTTSRPSKAQKKEEQNQFYLGGMRNPGIAVSKLHMVREVGKDIRRLWEKDHASEKAALNIAKRYGDPEVELDMEILEKWKAKLYKLLRVEKLEGGTLLREAVEFKSPLDPSLLDAWSKQTKDPEQCLGRWAREGAPLGMDEMIPQSNGIFPPSQEGLDPIDDPCIEFSTMMSVKNYSSFEEQRDDAEVEIDRYLEKGFAKERPWDWIKDNYKSGTLSKLALIVKDKPGGGKKRRVVIDMRRSGGNARAIISERITLPRANDVVCMLRTMKALEGRYDEDAWEVGIPKPRSPSKPEMELMVIDLKDAFCHFPVHPNELRHCVSPSLRETHGLVWVAMLFGFRGAPLIMGRLSAFIGRMIQSLFAQSEAQVQVYVDDVLIAFAGERSRREAMLALVIYTLAAFGIQLSLGKGERGKRLQWIGTTFEIDGTKVKLGVPEKMVQEVQKALEEWKTRGMIGLRELRQVLGKLAWIAGIVPRMRWAISSMYALVADAEQDLKEGKEELRARNREGDNRSKAGLVHVKRLGSAHPWLLALLKESHRFLIREEPLVMARPIWAIVTDASPKGLGAMLVHIGTSEPCIVEAMQAVVTEEVASALKVPFGESGSQAVLEALAVVRSVKLWGPKLQRMALVIKSDSTVALAMTKKLASPHVSLNYLAAELAIELECQAIPQILTKHLPGRLNDESDFLSRPEVTNMPATLEKVKVRRVAAMPETEFHLTPPGVNGGWVGSTPHPKSVFDCLGG